MVKKLFAAALALILAAVAEVGNAALPQISAGWNHTVVLNGDGTVWAWGNNANGQLGNGTEGSYSSVPVQAQGLTGAAAVSAGVNHTVALKGDTVWTWGDNYYGQLGDGTMYINRRSTPLQVQGLTGVTAVAAGYEHTVVLKGDGTVWAWGNNYFGQLGDGNNINMSTPVQVQGLTGVRAVAAGTWYTVALKDDGTVWAWGHNEWGQLGDGTTTDSYAPVQVQGLTGVTAVAAGWAHAVALRDDTTVWGWGNNMAGQLGDGDWGNGGKSIPVQVLGLTGVTAVAAGSHHTVALKGDTTVWAWGAGFGGQLGDGTYGYPGPGFNSRTTPVQAQGLTGATAVAAGMYHTAALKSDDSAWAWGWNRDGQLGDGTTIDRPTPVQVIGTNLPPVLAPIGNISGQEGGLIEFTVSATDPNGDLLTYSATNLPPGATFDTATGVFSWTPGYDQAGNFENIVFTVIDNANPLGVDSELITITVGDVNRKPIVTTPGAITSNEYQLVTFTVSATDPDGDAITSLSISPLPAGASFDPATGVFSWLPLANQAGVHNLGFFAVDDGSPAETGEGWVILTVGEVTSPGGVNDVLIDIVQNTNLPTTVYNPYMANLKNVETFIAEGRIVAALNQLNAVANKIEQDLASGLITQELADLLNAMIGDLIALLS